MSQVRAASGEPTVGDAIVGTGRAIKKTAKGAWSTPLAAILAVPVFFIAWFAIFITIETVVAISEKGVGGGGADGVPAWSLPVSFLLTIFLGFIACLIFVFSRRK